MAWRVVLRPGRARAEPRPRGHLGLVRQLFAPGTGLVGEGEDRLVAHDTADVPPAGVPLDQATFPPDGMVKGRCVINRPWESYRSQLVSPAGNTRLLLESNR